MAKMQRERAVKERRERKAEKKRAKKLAAASGETDLELADTDAEPEDAGDVEAESVV